MLRVLRLRRRMLRRTTMINLSYRSSPLLNDRDRSAGLRLPNPLLRSPDGSDIRLYDLLPVGPVMLDVAAKRDFAIDLPVEHVIPTGRGGFTDPGNLLRRRLLGGHNGWILGRPDAHVAWARR